MFPKLIGAAGLLLFVWLVAPGFITAIGNLGEATENMTASALCASGSDDPVCDKWEERKAREAERQAKLAVIRTPKKLVQKPYKTVAGPVCPDNVRSLGIMDTSLDSTQINPSEWSESIPVPIQDKIRAKRRAEAFRRICFNGVDWRLRAQTDSNEYCQELRVCNRQPLNDGVPIPYVREVYE